MVEVCVCSPVAPCGTKTGVVCKTPNLPAAGVHVSPSAKKRVGNTQQLECAAGPRGG